MSRVFRAIGGLIADQGCQIVSLGVVFFSTPILLSHLGATDYGFWITVMTILGYIGLIDPGLGIQITRKVAVGGSDYGMRGFLSTAFYVQFSFAVIFIIVGLMSVLIIHEYVILPESYLTKYLVTYIFAILVGAIGAISGYFIAVLAGRQRLIESSLLSSVQPIVGLAIGSIAIVMGGGLLALPMAYLLAALAALSLSYVLASRHEKNISFAFQSVRRAELPQLAGVSLYFQMTKLAFVVLMNTPTIVIAIVLGPAAVAAYTVSAKLAQTGGALIARAANVAYPGVSELHGNGDQIALKRVLINLQFNAARVGLWYAFVVYLINDQFVQLWVGVDFYTGPAFTIAVCAMVVRDSIVRSTGIILFASSNVKMLGWLSLVEAALTILLTYYLTLEFGILGAALGPLVATVIVISPYSLIKAARIADTKVLQLLWYGLGRVLVRSVPAGLVLWLIVNFLPKSWGWAWLISVCGIAIVINVTIFDLSILWSKKEQPWRERLKAMLEAR